MPIRGKMLAMLMDAHRAGQLKFFNTQAGLADKRTFKRFVAPLRRIKWVVYCKEPFAGPRQVMRRALWGLRPGAAGAAR